MHTDHKKEEVTEVTKVTMCIVAGMFLVGKLVGGNKLMDPRIFTLFDEPQVDLNGEPIIDPKTGKQKIIPKMQLSPLPALPPFVIVARMGMSYPIPEKDNIYKLYEQVTTPPEKKVVVPIAPGIDAKLN